MTGMRPIFCGNLENDARQSELERLFGRYGKVDRIDMKSGFAFIYMEDERDAEDAIRRLDRIEFGRHGRRLRVEWTKQERGGRSSGGGRKSPANARPSKTLFVINFDPINTRTRDLERHFEPYGKVMNVRIRRNFAFILYETQDEATKALEATNMSKLMDRVISVEYAVRDDDDRGNGHNSERRGRDRSPERRSRDHGRSASPYGRGMERASPDYGRGPSPYNSKPENRGSPNYGRAESPAYERQRSRESPAYERQRSRESPAYKRHHSRSRSRSPARRSSERRKSTPARRSSERRKSSPAKHSPERQESPPARRSSERRKSSPARHSPERQESSLARPSPEMQEGYPARRSPERRERS